MLPASQPIFASLNIKRVPDSAAAAATVGTAGCDAQLVQHKLITDDQQAICQQRVHL